MDNQREVAAMAENHGLSIETIVAEACALMRLHLKAQGIEVTHASHQHSHDLVGNEAGEPSFLYRTGSSRGPFVDTGVGLSLPRLGPVALGGKSAQVGAESPKRISIADTPSLHRSQPSELCRKPLPCVSR